MINWDLVLWQDRVVAVESNAFHGLVLDCSNCSKSIFVAIEEDKAIASLTVLALHRIG
jgi:hypothetical protein